MPDQLFTLHPIRTSKQGVQINIGKYHDEYDTMCNLVTMHPEDMRELRITANSSIRIRTADGEAVFKCQEGKVPRGMIFVPYGPPTCRLMGGNTDGTGMPTSKGWEVTVEPLE
ncbi:MAG: hypothetical protein EBV06_07670 [Planctomycetia bacterium]|nr:hypothetical protein [Planctomycetia bacterium]